MWPFTRRPQPEPSRDVLERLDHLEDMNKHLERRFIRLQQQFTRMVRDLEDLAPLDEDDDIDEDDVLDEINKRRVQHG